MRRRAVAWLPVLIRLTALGYLAFFVPNLMLAATDRISTLPPLLGRLFDWGEGRGDPAVAVMFCTVYVAWAIFFFAPRAIRAQTACSSISTSPRTPPTSRSCWSWL
jgi:hypothetical protein